VSLDDLISRSRVWRGSGARAVPRGLATGFDALDAYLPGGGWPQGAITEVFLERYGIGELSLFMPALARLSQGERWIVWVDPPFIPYAPALTRSGVDLNRVLLVHSSTVKQESLWAVEQALRSKSSVATLAWLKLSDDRDLRRLQLAAEERACWSILFRPLAAMRHRSPAALRIKLSGDSQNIRIEIIKCRGKRPGSVALAR